MLSMNNKKENLKRFKDKLWGESKLSSEKKSSGSQTRTARLPLASTVHQSSLSEKVFRPQKEKEKPCSSVKIAQHKDRKTFLAKSPKENERHLSVAYSKKRLLVPSKGKQIAPVSDKFMKKTAPNKTKLSMTSKKGPVWVATKLSIRNRSYNVQTVPPKRRGLSKSNLRAVKSFFLDRKNALNFLKKNRFQRKVLKQNLLREKRFQRKVLKHKRFFLLTRIKKYPFFRVKGRYRRAFYYLLKHFLLLHRLYLNSAFTQIRKTGATLLPGKLIQEVSKRNSPMLFSKRVALPCISLSKNHVQRTATQLFLSFFRHKRLLPFEQKKHPAFDSSAAKRLSPLGAPLPQLPAGKQGYFYASVSQAPSGGNLRCPAKLRQPYGGHHLMTQPLASALRAPKVTASASLPPDGSEAESRRLAETRLCQAYGGLRLMTQGRKVVFYPPASPYTILVGKGESNIWQSHRRWKNDKRLKTDPNLFFAWSPLTLLEDTTQSSFLFLKILPRSDGRLVDSLIYGAQTAVHSAEITSQKALIYFKKIKVSFLPCQAWGVVNRKLTPEGDTFGAPKERHLLYAPRVKQHNLSATTNRAPLCLASRRGASKEVDVLLPKAAEKINKLGTSVPSFFSSLSAVKQLSWGNKQEAKRAAAFGHLRVPSREELDLKTSFYLLSAKTALKGHLKNQDPYYMTLLYSLIKQSRIIYSENYINAVLSSRTTIIPRQVRTPFSLNQSGGNRYSFQASDYLLTASFVVHEIKRWIEQKKSAKGAVQQVIKDFRRSLAFFFDVSQKSPNFDRQNQGFDLKTSFDLEPIKVYKSSSAFAGKRKLAQAKTALEHESLSFPRTAFGHQSLSFPHTFLKQLENRPQRLPGGLERKDLWGHPLKPLGIRIAISGCLGRKGAKAKTFWKQAGAVSPHVFDQPVDFSVGAASTRLGEIGIRVLICYQSTTPVLVNH